MVRVSIIRIGCYSFSVSGMVMSVSVKLCLRVCVSVCPRDISDTARLIFTNFCARYL